MSDLLIRGMEMPETCFKCKLSRMTPSIYAWCILTEKCYPADQPPPVECPLIPVPPHGRLIDADALLSKDYQVYNEYGDVIGRRHLSVYDIQEAPTIIQAEEGE